MVREGFAVLGTIAAFLLPTATPAAAQPDFQARLAASDGVSGDFFGFPVSVDGNTAVIGAQGATVSGHGDQGAAYVFVRNGSAWSQQTKLVASDGATGDQFGSSVAVSGEYVLVAAHSADSPGRTDQGAVYVFVRSGSSWTQQAKLTSTDGAAGDFFGEDAALEGNTALIGADGAEAAYVFTRTGSAWSQAAKLTAASAAAFGGSVDLDGTSAIVGAPDTDGRGAAYVFTGSGASWTQQAKLSAGDGAADDLFALDVSLSGNTAAVGAAFAEVGDQFEQGAAYLFVRSGASWSQQAKLTANDGTDGDFFGRSVAVQGDTVIAGAPAKTVGSNGGQGAAYQYVRNGASWTQGAKLTASDGEEGDNFGSGLAISGSTALSGASFGPGPNSADQGAVYTYTGAVTTTLTYYLHGNDIPGTAGGYTMNATAPSPQTLTLNLLSAPRWYGDPALNGTFGAGSTFTFKMPCVLGLSVARTYSLAATAPDGSNSRSLGQATVPLGLCIGSETVRIPVTVPKHLAGERLRLQISTVLSLNLNLALGPNTRLVATGFTPDF